MPDNQRIKYQLTDSMDEGLEGPDEFDDEPQPIGDDVDEDNYEEVEEYFDEDDDDLDDFDDDDLD